MKQHQLMQTLDTLKAYPVNEASRLFAAYICEWFKTKEDSFLGQLLTLQAVAIVAARTANDERVVEHLTYQLCKVWEKGQQGGKQDE